MREPGRRAFAISCALWLACHVGPWAPCAQAQCLPNTVGLDPANFNNFRGTILGIALGQTFLAVDTLITRITVWRPPNQINSVGTKLFVTAVDTSRTPPRPDTGTILLKDPSVFVRDSDPPGQLIEMSFVIDPPLALPRPGIYAFFLQRDGCNGGETDIVASEADPYPYGIYWIAARVTTLPCQLRPVAGGEDFTDLIFKIEFCRDGPTPARPQTWGALKIIYR